MNCEACGCDRWRLEKRIEVLVQLLMEAEALMIPAQPKAERTLEA